MTAQPFIPSVPLTVLTVAYPLAPVGPDVSGGAEQIASALDRAVIAAGHRSVVVARADSSVAGDHIATPVQRGPYTKAVQAAAQAQHRLAIAAALERFAVDVVHMHGVDFERYLPGEAVPAVVTLHLPRVWYSPEARAFSNDRVQLVCVSTAQQRSWDRPVPVIENGIAVERFRLAPAKRFVLTLGRICGEKAAHLAIDAAARARVPIAIAGALFPYPEHQEYFDRQIAPRLGRGRAVYIGPANLRRKQRLLASAQAVLVPSIAPETSSLVAMEAMASGAPVIAFRQGALPDIVEHGHTGFIVDSVEAMAEAIAAARSLDRSAIRRHAQQRFHIDRMFARYFELYEQLAVAELLPTRQRARR